MAALEICAAARGAVPTQIVYNALSARVTKITGDIEAMANFLLEVREEMTA